MLDNAVTQKLADYEIQVNQNFRKWYKQSLINVLIIGILVASGLISYFFSDKTGVLKFLVALAYLFSILIFLYRRILNVRTLVQKRKEIQSYGHLVLKGLFSYKFGLKIRLTVYDLYMHLYEELVSDKKIFLHKLGAKLHLVPDQKEVFEIIYGNLLLFFWNVIYKNLLKFLSFTLVFAAFSFFVKNSVLIEMQFDTIFETLKYPFVYFYELIRTLFQIS